jgi:RNA polymerase sigma-70 factor (ECF subfamily)
MTAAYPASTARDAASAGGRAFDEIYDAYFPYIWRSVQRLGVPASRTDDVVQEVFIIAYRKLDTFAGRSSIKTWLYGIALHRARSCLAEERRDTREEPVDAERIHAPDATRPGHRAEYAEAARVVDAVLCGLDGDQREVFVLAELEELSAPEIAEVLGVRLNTVYSRLRLAREAFVKASARYRAQSEWRTR